MTKKENSKIEKLADKLGIKKENLDKAMKEDSKKTESMIKKAARFMELS